ncbi:hypothetical protein [Cellulomonas sp. URHD0024]|uniref:hypothetical protein n=1 Tax=Cellulomonas sp. URHD0024 TaxID=1302620 RepID=UPI00041187EE|nr:hypothetical protein [Cellulomonas sp. URHD0024]
MAQLEHWGDLGDEIAEGRRSNGDVVRFDHRTGTLGVHRGDVIIAWFRPDEGFELYLREVAK